MIDIIKLMELAAERIRPYLPDMYELDDFSWGEDIFQIRVFNCSRPELYHPVDTFRFGRDSGESDEEMMARFDRKVQNFAESWR